MFSRRKSETVPETHLPKIVGTLVACAQERRLPQFFDSLIVTEFLKYETKKGRSLGAPWVGP